MLDSTTPVIQESKRILDINIGASFKNNLEVSLKYFRDIDMHIGWSILWVVDPIIAPWVAAAILEGLKQCQLIQNVVYPTPLLLQDRCLIDKSDSNALWTIESTSHVFPGMTFRLSCGKIYCKC